jgi:endonuclease/exonuclease/phosphatase family metal-dependent hydrolase
MVNYYVAWWNLENLFDVEDSAERPDWLAKALKTELAGWTDAILDRKISQLSSVITRMNDGRGPDLLGVCEVENKPVVAQLTEALQANGRNYQVAHHDTSDQRGIDVAFIYDASLLTAQEQFFHIILKREATRDLFQVNFQTRAGRDLIIVGNHWPSRTGGQYESEPYRILAAETLSYWMKRILEIKGEDVAVVVMGDFNDEPFDRSMLNYALSTSSRTRAKLAQSPRLYNLMWPLMGQALATHYYQNFPNMLDQFLVSRGFLQEDAAFTVNEQSVTIIRFPDMIDAGQYHVPRRFGRPSSSLDQDGFSDHFPIAVMVTEKT